MDTVTSRNGLCIKICLILGLARRFKLWEFKRLEVFLYSGSYIIRRNIFERLKQTVCKKCSCVSERGVWRSLVAEKQYCVELTSVSLCHCNKDT